MSALQVHEGLDVEDWETDGFVEEDVVGVFHGSLRLLEVLSRLEDLLDLESHKPKYQLVHHVYHVIVPVNHLSPKMRHHIVFESQG